MLNPESKMSRHDEEQAGFAAMMREISERANQRSSEFRRCATYTLPDLPADLKEASARIDAGAERAAYVRQEAQGWRVWTELSASRLPSCHIVRALPALWPDEASATRAALEWEQGGD